MLKLLSECSYARSGTQQLLTQSILCTTSGPITSSLIGLSNAESRRFARNTKPWSHGPHELMKQGIINYDYRRARAKKWAKVQLPDFVEINDRSQEQKLTPEEMRSKLKEKGVVPHRVWDERPLYVSTSNMIMDPYVPPEGDGKISIISKENAKKQMEKLTGRGKDFLSLRKIRSYLPEFEPSHWVSEGQRIYEETNKALAERDLPRLYDLVTEKCLPEMLFNVQFKTIRWNLIKSLEPPRVVHVRHEEAGEGNVFAQLTVRFHTQQTLAVYDKFGRLVHGSEAIIKDVLEYVVFEYQLTNQYASWRIHGKIIPKWNERQNFSRLTSVKPELKESQVN